MSRTLFALAVLVCTAWAANIKLYLKDGSFHLVREYQVESDRVRFYSVERSEWEEMPLNLVDVDKTRKEEAQHRAEIEKEAKDLSEEDAFERQQQQLILRIPENPGVYWFEGDQTRTIKAAESSVHTNKGRSVLKVLSPIPAVSGKATVEIDGSHSMNVFTSSEPEFYLQLSDPERFGIARLKPKAGVRIVENVTIMPVTKEVMEEPEMVEIFQSQLTPGGLYKIWPKSPLEPGEYAVVEYTMGKLNMQVWDFAVKSK